LVGLEQPLVLWGDGVGDWGWWDGGEEMRGISVAVIKSRGVDCEIVLPIQLTAKKDEAQTYNFKQERIRSFNSLRH
jgi:hypothetical protein